MTAESELFCNEVVRDEAEELFGKQIPDYEHIKVQDEWKGINAACGFPNSGEIIYADEKGNPVAKVSFKVKFKTVEYMEGRFIEAEPIELKLQIINEKEIRKCQKK